MIISKKEKETKYPLDAKVDKLTKKIGCRGCAAERVFNGKSDLHNHPEIPT